MLFFWECVYVLRLSLVFLYKLYSQRGPRYFDPPDCGWGAACYNCGEEGHTTMCCTSAKRKRPCFVCGSLEHNVRHCVKVCGRMKLALIFFLLFCWFVVFNFFDLFRFSYYLGQNGYYCSAFDNLTTIWLCRDNLIGHLVFACCFRIYVKFHSLSCSTIW